MIEETRPVQSGVELLTQTRENWLDSLIGSHINWHLALYYYGKRLSMRTYIQLWLFIRMRKFIRAVRDVAAAAAGCGWVSGDLRRA